MIPVHKAPYELSIILPTYKERHNLELLIPDIEKVFQAFKVEIVVIDDHSGDGTVELIEMYNKNFGNVRIIERPGLLGIGSAIRDGYNAAHGEYILSCDADLSFTTGDMLRLFQKIQEGYDMVLGYKIQYLPPTIAKEKKISLRLRMNFLTSRLANLTVQLFSWIALKNFNTNFRILRMDKWKALQTYENSNFFLFETVFKAVKKGYRITEIPVTYYERRFGESKLNFFKEAPVYFKKLLQHTLGFHKRSHG